MEITIDEKNGVVLSILNEARMKEFFAAHQYDLHHLQLEYLGYSNLAEEMMTIAVEEMRHAEILGQRIKVLEGSPVSKSSLEAIDHDRPFDIFTFDADTELKAIEEYNKYIDICRVNLDSVSEEIFKSLINDEQRHFEYFDNVKNLIENLGDSYLAEQAKPFMSSQKGGV